MFVEKRSKYTDYRIPAMAISEQGIIYVAFECREDDSDWANIDLRIMKSADNGDSFSEVHKVYGNGKTMNNPVLVVKGDAIHFLYCEEYRRVFHIRSNDEGKSWSKPLELTDIFNDLEHTVVATGPGHGIVTADGTMVVPVWLAYNPEDPYAHKPSHVTTMYSEDDGETWKHGERLEEAELIDGNETTAALLSDGRVLLNIRNRHPKMRRYLAVSPNGYSDWEYLGHDERFVDPRCMGSMCNGDGQIFFCNCESEKNRERLTLKSSSDDFTTFISQLLCEKAGYSEIAYWKNLIFVLYETYEDFEGNRINHRLHLKKIKLNGED